VPPRDPTQILDAARRAALGYANATNARNVADLMKRSQADLKDRLKAVPKTDQTFTAVQMRATLKQVEAVLSMTKSGLLGTVLNASDVVAGHGARSTVRYLDAAESAYGGVGGAGLGINTAQVFDQALSGTRASVLRRIAGDPTQPGQPGVIDRYGDGVIDHFEKTLQTSIVTARPWDDVRQGLIDGSPFLQDAPQYWAERIVRTELMGAYNTSGNAALNAVNDQTGGAMIRILCATFDSRTGADSYAVHGQIRRMAEAFVSWFGSYMTPPNRPNDREIVVPHYPHWPIPANLKPKTDAEVAARWTLMGRKGAPPPRPLMSTVPLDANGNPVAEKPAAPAPLVAPTPKPELPRAAEPPPAVSIPARALPLVAPGRDRPLTLRAKPDVAPAEQVIDAAPGIPASRDEARAVVEEARAAQRAARDARVEAERLARDAEDAIAAANRVRDLAIAEARASMATAAAKADVALAGIPAAHIEAARAAARSVPANAGPTGEPPVSNRIPIGDPGAPSFEALYGAPMYSESAQAAINAASRAVFGRDFDPRDFSGLLSLHELKGVRFDEHVVAEYKNRDGSHRLALSVNIHNPNVREEGGRIERVYYRAPDGIHVVHEFFKMPASLRAGGDGARLIESQFATYRKLGVAVVETHAVWDGQYVWPSMGFGLTHPTQLGSYKEEFARWAQGERPTADERGGMRSTPALPHPVPAADLLPILDSVKTIQDLAALEINGVAVGKEFLRYRGHRGVGELIDLRLNLKSPDDVGRLTAYFAERARIRAAKKAAIASGATPDQAAKIAKRIAREPVAAPAPKVTAEKRIAAEEPAARASLGGWRVGDRVEYDSPRFRTGSNSGVVEGFTGSRVRIRSANGAAYSVSPRGLRWAR
jgi:hypothetical protein